MLSACKERGVKLLCAVSPSAGTDALEAASHGTKGLFFCRGSAPELGNEWTVLLSWGRVRSAANGSPAAAVG